jgi:hypothetical protein
VTKALLLLWGRLLTFGGLAIRLAAITHVT